MLNASPGTGTLRGLRAGILGRPPGSRHAQGPLEAGLVMSMAPQTAGALRPPNSRHAEAPKQQAR
eukprot:19294-Chlamydomonas_euryale.AAC.2